MAIAHHGGVHLPSVAFEAGVVAFAVTTAGAVGKKWFDVKPMSPTKTTTMAPPIRPTLWLVWRAGTSQTPPGQYWACCLEKAL